MDPGCFADSIAKKVPLWYNNSQNSPGLWEPEICPEGGGEGGNSVKKCCFIIPYYGKLPDFLPVFAKSCERNPDFDWLLFTNDTTPPLPENVRVIHSTLDEFKTLAEQKLGFPVRIDKAYKLCDFKPAYGFLFEEYLTEYAFWGHCDLDVILGKLGDFLTDDLLAQYDKLFCLGHMTIYRNNPENNRIFMCEHNGISLYREVFSNPEICWFDEEYRDDNNINQIFLRQGRRVYRQDLSLNMFIGTRKFRRTEYVGRDHSDADDHGYITEDYCPALYYWDQGRLLRIRNREGKVEQQSFLYMHLQYRKMRYHPGVLSAECFRIVPNRLLSARSLPRSPVAVSLIPKTEFIGYRILQAVKRIFRKIMK